MKNYFRSHLLVVALVCFPGVSFAEKAALKAEFNYDEAKVPQYELPNPLTFEDGTKVTTPEQWPKRRAEILELFEENVYGKRPVTPEKLPFAVMKEVDGFLEGKAMLKEIRIFFGEKGIAPYADLLLITPKSDALVPAFLALNFAGNHSLHSSPEISITQSWSRQWKDCKEAVIGNKATEDGRGIRSRRWPVEKIIDSGCALASVYYGDIDPDYDDQFRNGVHALYGKPKPNEWGSIATWAYGLSSCLDYLIDHESGVLDSKRIAAMGHSRLAKTALWAGANDERFPLVIANNGGCGGTALSRRAYGGTMQYLNTANPHWFNQKCRSYDGNEDALPVDQHQLVALIAPRMVYVASAIEDRQADPMGEFLSAKHASPVYELLGKKGVGVDQRPPLGSPVGGHLRYHIRSGRHDVTDYDWEQYIKALKSL